MFPNTPPVKIDVPKYSLLIDFMIEFRRTLDSKIHSKGPVSEWSVNYRNNVILNYCNDRETSLIFNPPS